MKDLEPTENILSHLAELQEENLHLRGALHESLAELIALREQIPNSDALERCIKSLRISLTE